MLPIRRWLSDEAVDLGAGEARHLFDEPLQQSLVRSPEAVVLEADQRAAHEGVGRGAVGELEVRRFIAVQAAPDPFEGASRSARSVTIILQ